jgi:flagellar biogenesis protein FliO
VKRGLGRYGKTGKMIEVVSTHYLGPKKSIAVVKVAGRMLVLGVSQDNISLITQLGATAALDEAAVDDLDLEALGVQGVAPRQETRMAEREAPGTGARAAFGALLADEASRPSATAAARMPAMPVLAPPEPEGVRARIRTRLEGMKPL